MVNYEFDGFFDSAPVVSDAKNVESSDEVSKNDFLDFFDGDCYYENKLLKKAKKATKIVKGCKKKVKKLSSRSKRLEQEVFKIKEEMKSLKQTAYTNKLEELINCESLTGRKMKAQELRKLEVKL